MYCLFVYFSVLYVLPFICILILSCYVVIYFAIKAGVLTSHKTRFTSIFFFLKMFCTKLGKWRLLSYSPFLCVLHCRLFFCCTLVFLLFRCFPLIFDAFPSVLVCNPDLLFLNRFMTFERRYTTMGICLYLFLFILENRCMLVLFIVP